MSTFIIKIIACSTMIIDHIGCVLECKTLHNFFNYDILVFMREIGRIGFPLFAFLLVNGFQNTRNRNLYLKNLIIFSVISQIPFTLALYSSNGMELQVDKSTLLVNIKFLLSPLYISIPALILLPIGYYIYQSNKKFDLGLLFLIISLLISLFRIEILDTMITKSNFLNVFYTLSIGLICLDFIDNIKLLLKNKKYFTIIFKIIIIILATLFLASRSDYGIEGVILIIALFIFKKYKFLQVCTICVYGIYFNGLTYGNWNMAFFTCLSVIPIIFYNRQKGKNYNKYIFYWFYPIHLLVLGLINIIYKYILTIN